MEELLKKYIDLKITLSLEEERNLAFEYVYLTNRLEGNRLSLVQTTQLLDTETISGQNIRTKDILEQKGMYKALLRMGNAVNNKEDLSVNLLIELNGLVLSSLWKDDAFYNDAKAKGQELDSFKVVNNIISIAKQGEEIERIEPLSSPENVRHNMEKLIQLVNQSEMKVEEKAVNLAKQLWLHQPFLDGNKRTGRLLINYLTMKGGYPLFTYTDSEKGNYNTLLIQEYFDKKEGLLLDYISDKLKSTMQNYITENKNIKKPNKGFGMQF
jgi:Fic family protein